MKRSASASTAAAALMLLALTGCATPVAEVPAIDPGPVELTAEQAGERYLNIVCPNNFGMDAMDAAFAEGAAEHLDGGTPDPAAVKAAGEELVELNRQAIEHFEDDYFIWPEEVADLIPHMRTIYNSELALNRTVASSATFGDAYETPIPVLSAEVDAASQEIRNQLNLGSDPVASCVGHEDGLTRLAGERADREAALAGS